jgi:hypothetical protein
VLTREWLRRVSGFMHYEPSLALARAVRQSPDAVQ